MTNTETEGFARAQSNGLHGYLSDESKTTFTITAGILGGVFFLLQFVVPFVAMFAVMPFMFDTMSDMRVIAPDKGAFWKGSLWMIEEPIGPPAPTDEPRTARLVRWTHGAHEELQEVAKVGWGDASLLASADTLWIITPRGVGILTTQGIEFQETAEQLGGISRPFFLDGRPAVVEDHAEGYNLRVFEQGRWRSRGSYSPAVVQGQTVELCDLQIVNVGDDLSVFIFYRGTVYHRTGLIDHPGVDPPTWESVVHLGQGARRWHAVAGADTPTVFAQLSGMESEIQGWRRDQGEWRIFFSLDMKMPVRAGAYATEVRDRFALASQTMPGSLTIRVAEGGQILQKVKVGEGFPFQSKMMMGMMFITYGPMFILPFVLAFVLSWLMRRHRLTEHRWEDLVVPHASLIRRAIAQLVDVIAIFGPLGVIWILSVRRLMDMEEQGPEVIFKMFGLVAPAVLWIVACFFIFSFLEGRWGVTPGKLVAGIRVIGTNLEPCGFGRALIRNLLKLVDGFFNFMVGMLVVALTHNWQRVGDMAASTIVVRAGRRRRLDPPTLPLTPPTST